MIHNTGWNGGQYEWENLYPLRHGERLCAWCNGRTVRKPRLHRYSKSGNEALSVKRYMSMFRQTGDVDSHAKFGGHKKAKLAGHEQTIIDLLTKQPDITLQALTALLVQKNVHTSATGLFFFLKALGFGYKKNGIWSRAETQGRSGSKGSVQKTAKRA